MLTENYHAHTYRCGHATGTEREFVERAIEGGVKIMGFSDHAPMPYDGVYESGIRMKLSEMEGYVDTVLALKKEYSADIELHLGLEAEYYPRFFEAFLDFIAPYPVEYLLLGQHYLENEVEGKGTGEATRDPARLKTYVDQVITGMETGRFFYLAHPDLIRFEPETEEERRLYLTEMGRICDAANRLSVPLEINLLGIATRRSYPTPLFWELVGKKGNEVCIGVDAHHVEMVLLPEAEQKAMALVKQYGLKLIPHLRLNRRDAE